MFGRAAIRLGIDPHSSYGRRLGSLVVGAFDLLLDGREFDSRPPRVTVFERVNHLGISPSHSDQISLQPCAGREMSTGQSAMIQVSKSRYGSFPMYTNVRVAGKTA